MANVIQLRAVRQGQGTTDTDLYDVDPMRDAFGRFASGATLRFADTDGTKQSSYPNGQRVEIEYSTDGGSTWTRRQAGVVQDTTRTTKDALPQLEVDIVNYDHLLRRRKIYKDYSSQTISSILNDIITQFTSVNWVAANVTVQNDQTVDLPLRGVRVDEVIGQLAADSANEEWGVNNDLEFVFRQQDVSRARPITDADVIDYDLPEQGKRAINRFKLFYGSNGDNFVVKEDRERQQELKDKLNAPRRVVISDSDTIPEITTESRAEKVATNRLGERSVIQTGDVRVPFGRFETEAGDVLDLTISDAGISDEGFRVAQIDYNWTRGETVLTVAENRGENIDDLLLSLSDSLSNVRSRAADPAATGTRYLDFQNGVELSISASLTTKETASGSFVLGQSELGQGSSDTLGGGIASTSSVSVDTKKVTASTLNACRDLWQDGNAAFTDQTHLGAGTDAETATRADDSLQAPVDRVDLGTFSAGNQAERYEYVGTIPAGGQFAQNTLRELGIFDADSGGNCYLRLTHADLDLDSSTRLNVHLEVTIDVDTSEQGVVTATGQERLRDLVVGESGHEPTDMVYGTGTTAAVEGDTALGSQAHEDSIDSFGDRATGITDVVERIGAGEVNGNDLAELGYENSSDELLARVTFEALSKTSDFALETDYRFRAVND